jgi:hypothetical protein
MNPPPPRNQDRKAATEWLLANLRHLPLETMNPIMAEAPDDDRLIVVWRRDTQRHDLVRRYTLLPSGYTDVWERGTGDLLDRLDIGGWWEVPA